MFVTEALGRRSYSSSAPVTSYYAPTTTYYSSSVPVTTYYGSTATSYYSPYTTYYAQPVIVSPKVYIPGQPVRNAVRAVTP